MKLKKAIKKIVALGMGATMLGATILGATAAKDLALYPAPFVTNGVFNGYFIVEGNADDNLAVVDIATHLYTAGTGSSQTTVTGDAWKVGTGSKFLEMANSNVSSSTIVGENFNNIVTYIGKDELGALAAGTYATTEKEVNYNQYLYFDSTDTTSEIVKYVENDDDVTADFLFIKSAAQIAKYKLEFTSQAESDVTDSTGSASTTGDYLDDFEDTKLTLMGTTYDVVLARRTADENTTRLVLMGGATKKTMMLDESDTIEFNGKTYTVSVNYIDSTYAKITVNGEATNKLKVGDTQKLSDGTEVGVTEILYQGFAGGVQSTTFFIGANKVELKDSDIEVAGGSDSLIVGSEDIDGTKVIITGTDNNVKQKFSTIELNMTAEDDYFVPAGGKLSDVIAAAGEEKEVLFNGNFDIEYKGLTSEDMHDIKLDSSTDTKYELKFYDGDNNAVTLPLAYASGTYNISLGEEDQGTTSKSFVINETNTIYKNNYLIATGGTITDGSGKSYALQYKGADATSKTSPKIKFKNLGSGETLEYSVPTAVTSNYITDIKLGGYSFKVNNATPASSDDFAVYVSMNGDSDVIDVNPGIVDQYGARIVFTTDSTFIPAPNATSPDSLLLTIDTPNGNDYDNFIPSTTTLNITSTSGPELRATFKMDGGDNLLQPEGETEIKYGYTSMGGKVTFESPSSGANKFTYNYPANQKLPQVYFTSGVTEAMTVGGNLVAVTIPLTATKRVAEVSDVAAQNVITIGGPCANSATADIMYPTGAPDDCTQGFTPGKAMIKFYDNGANVALVVAGYSGTDTRRAGKVLGNAANYGLSGAEVEVEGTTYSDMTVTKVA